MRQVRQDLREGLARLLLEHDVPGASVSVGVGEETCEAAAGVVNRRTGVAATPASLFQIQSITKVWTATLVMQLVDEGLVGLDDPARSHLPSFSTADPEASAAVTVRHLLTHTGGFEGDLWQATSDGDDALQRLVDDLVPRAPQHEAPGSRYSYCSAGMAVLGRLVEVKRGLTFAAALRAHLAVPLGIDELAFDADEALGFTTAIGHEAYGDGAVRPLPVWATMPTSNPAAGNRLSMSARALTAFGRMHLSGGLGPGGERVLSEASAEAMRSFGTAIPPAPPLRKDVGLGWELIEGGRVVGHGGGALGFSSMLLLVPAHRMTVAVLTNGGDFKGLMRGLVDPWLEQAAGFALTTEPEEPDRHEAVEDPVKYIGVYGTRNQHVTVSATDGRLRLVIARTGEMAGMLARAGLDATPSEVELRRIDGDGFVMAGKGRHVQFLDVEDGRARFIHMGGRSIPRLEP